MIRKYADISRVDSREGDIGMVGISGSRPGGVDADIVFGGEGRRVGAEVVKPTLLQAAVVESVKAASDIYAPCFRQGRRVQFRFSWRTNPALLNTDPLRRGLDF